MNSRLPSITRARAGAAGGARAYRPVWRFTALTVVAFAVAGLAIFWFARDQAIERAETDTVDLVTRLSTAITRQAASSLSLREIVSGDGVSEFNRLYGKVASLRGTVFVRVFGSDGRAIYASDPRSIGSAGDERLIAAAFAGTTDVLVQDGFEPVGVPADRRLLIATYPVSLSDGAPPFIVVETALDYRQAVLDDVTPLTLPLIAVVGGSLVAVLLLLIPVLRRITGTLQRQNLDLQEAERRYRELVEHLPLVLWSERPGDDGPSVFASEYARELLGYGAQDWHAKPGLLAEIVHRDDRRPGSWAGWNAEAPWERELRLITRDGRMVWALERARIERDGDGEPVAAHGYLLDVTAQREAEQALRASEERLHAAQRLDAIGRLAGGVAHDFNNLLTVISGHAELGLSRDDADVGARSDFAQIHEAAERAAALTRQLLAFSRKQVLRAHAVELDEIVTGMETMLRRLIGEDVGLDVRLGGPPALLADRIQLEQLLMNLCVNARDAMPGGGRLSISTGTAALGATRASQLGLAEGVYATLAVADTGIGMDAATVERIFEPFFTTKRLGEGTGLGLATVHGIVRQSGGHVMVESAPGKGSRFLVHLPADALSDDPAEAATAQAQAPAAAGSTLLLVEDEPALRALLARSLGDRGYRVHAAADGPEALAIADGLDVAPDLLVTDVVMPAMSGRELADELGRRRAGLPALAVLYMSGYTDDAVLRHGISHSTADFLEKPFSPSVLAERVAAILGRERTALSA